MRRGYLLGFGGMVGLGVAVALIITVIAIGRDLGGQLTGAMSVVITFVEVAVCTALGVGAVFVVGLVVYRGQLARLHLAERQVQIEAQRQALGGGQWTAHTEVIGCGTAGALPRSEVDGVLMPADRAR
jgi:hypothetical protein